MEWKPTLEYDSDTPLDHSLASVNTLLPVPTGEGGSVAQENEEKQPNNVPITKSKAPQLCCQQALLKNVKKEPPDMEHVSKCLGWKPISVCEKTLKVTTQYAKNYLCLPMRDHYKAQFPALNCKHLNEVYAMDTFFASSKALGGYMCAQLYVGKTSMLTEVFGMKTENEMKDTLQDFIRKWGASTLIVIR